MKSIVINFSGHPLCQKTQEILKNKYEVLLDVSPFNFDFEGEAEVQLEGLLRSINYVIDGSSALTIIPPGQSTFSILLVSYLHGLTGHFPKVCYLEMNDDGLFLPKTDYDISVQRVRAAGRKFRSEMCMPNKALH
jgi:hypothetical protein